MNKLEVKLSVILVVILILFFAVAAYDGNFCRENYDRATIAFAERDYDECVSRLRLIDDDINIKEYRDSYPLLCLAQLHVILEKNGHMKISMSELSDAMNLLDELKEVGLPKSIDDGELQLLSLKDKVISILQYKYENSADDQKKEILESFIYREDVSEYEGE